NAALIVRARDPRPLAARWKANRAGFSRVRRAHIQPDRLPSRNGSSTSHSTRRLFPDVRPPHEYASTLRVMSVRRPGLVGRFPVPEVPASFAAPRALRWADL